MSQHSKVEHRGSQQAQEGWEGSTLQVQPRRSLCALQVESLGAVRAEVIQRLSASTWSQECVLDDAFSSVPDCRRHCVKLTPAHDAMLLSHVAISSEKLLCTE